VLFLAVTRITFYERATAFIHSLFQFPNRNPNLSHHSLEAPLPSRFLIALHPEYPTMDLTSGLVGKASTRPTIVLPKYPQELHHQDLTVDSDAPASSSRIRVAPSPTSMCPPRGNGSTSSPPWTPTCPQQQIQDPAVDPNAPPQQHRGVLVDDITAKRQRLDDITVEDSDVTLPQQQPPHDNLAVDSGVPLQQQLEDPAADSAAPTKHHKGILIVESDLPPDLSGVPHAMAELVCKNWVQVEGNMPERQ
jgi:hypothetical protein